MKFLPKFPGAESVDTLMQYDLREERWLESGFFALIQYPLPLSFLGEFEQQDRLGRIRFQNGNTFQRAQRAA